MTPAERFVIKSALRRHQVLASVAAGVPGSQTALAHANRVLRVAVMDLMGERERGRRREEVTMADVVEAIEW